jgi:3-hydroxyisobutyrate dehydrogenase-like beta-hydroxyacid dehydrogenase
VSGRLVFAGLGQMGFHLARHVAAAAAGRGVDVTAYDVDPAARQRMGDARDVTVVDGLPGDLGAGDVLALSVPDGTATRAVIASLGPLDGAGGLTILDFSSVSPADARAIAAELAPFDVTYLDAPVTGGVFGAEQGTLTTIVGAGEEALRDVRWIPESFSGRVVAAGAVGAGALVKTLNNMIFNIGSIATMECIIVARKAGIPDDTLLDVLNHGTAATYFTEVRYPKYVRTRTFDAGMRVGLVNKDLGIALDAAVDAGCDLRLCAAGRQMWADALAALGPDADSTLMMDVVARATTGIGILDLLEDA